jgi:hypothetical protein
MATHWFKQILGSEKRAYRRWMASDAKEGKVKEKRREISERITAFKTECDRKGIVFRIPRDAWEAYWDENPHAHFDLGGDSADEALGEKACQVFTSLWLRASKPMTVRFEGDGLIAAAPTIMTLGSGTSRFRGNPISALRLTDPDERARAVEQLTDTLERLKGDLKTRTKTYSLLTTVIEGLKTGATSIEKDGEIFVQGVMLGAPELDAAVVEETDDDAE